MKTLIIKLGAAGDVVRTTSLLRILPGDVSWVTSDGNTLLFEGVERLQACVPWSHADTVCGNRYDLVINLEDSTEAACLLKRIKFKDCFGAYLNGFGKLDYTDDSREWFDLSLISRFGKERADQFKFENRKTYQEMVFGGLGYQFSADRYFVPKPIVTELKGDIAIAPEAGAVWPNKNWAYYEDLKKELCRLGYTVNVLPIRESILEHIHDIQNHRCLVSGDSLPMHIALGSGVRCVTLFTCTSPWEIYGYGIQEKIVSPRLGEFFYKRGYDQRAATSIPMDEVLDAVKIQMSRSETASDRTGE